MEPLLASDMRVASQSPSAEPTGKYAASSALYVNMPGSSNRLLERSTERSEVADLEKHIDQIINTRNETLKNATSLCDGILRKTMRPEIYEYSSRLRVPGGFRRDHLHACADADGIALEERPLSWSTTFLEGLFETPFYDVGPHKSFFNPLPRQDSSAQEDDRAQRGLGRFCLAVAIFKGNCNCNVLYMPGAWRETGWSFNLFVLPSLAALSTLCVVRLLRCRDGNELNYGELMELAGGRTVRIAVNISIVLMQTGVCCLYLINVASLVQNTFLPHVTVARLIFVEAALIAPLAMIRKVSTLSCMNLLAGILVIGGITVTICLLVFHIMAFGPQLREFEALKPNSMLVGLGTALFVFEGIGLVIPIYDSCRHPHEFVFVYSSVISFVVLLISTTAFLGYLAFGDSTRTLVLLNLTPGPVQKALQFCFAIAMLGTFPLQLLPAARLVESICLAQSRPNTWDKYIKSGLRMLIVALIAIVSVAGATSLANFVSLVGALCGLPLAYIYPAICHLKFRPGTAGERLIDYGIIGFGLIFTLVITIENLRSWGVVHEA